MRFTYERRYRGKIQAVLLDWAGTTMDYGCMAPAVVFVEVFKRQGVPITMDEARAPMGAHKRVHIKKITELPSVARRWQDKHGRKPTEADVDAMFAEFVPLQLGCLSEYSELIPGTLEAVAAMRTTTRTEGILPALETAHAIAALPKLLAGVGGLGGSWPADLLVLLGFSGRGDKDLAALERIDDVQPWGDA